MRNAASSVGEYLPASIAAIVWRVTPIRSPRSAWVISPVRKRKVRMSLTIGGLAMPAPPIADDHQNVARRLGDHERQQRGVGDLPARSEEHTSELQSLMRTSYAVFCLKKKNKLYRDMS